MSTALDALPVPVKITDPTAPAEPSWFEALVDRLTIPYLGDPRDVVFTRLAARIMTQIWPLAIALYLVPTWAVALFAVPYIAFLFTTFGGPVVLMLHCVSHRPVFKKGLRGLDPLMTHVIPPFFGMTPFAYYPHHVLMHHTESVSTDDLSGTAEYVRDDIGGFLHYWARFTFLGYYHMSSWLVRRKKWKSLRSMIIGETLTFALLAGLVALNPAAGLVVFVIPYCMLRFFLMAGNWTEHAFVDASDPTNDYKNSTCLLNTTYNHRCYNSGYHLIHHRAPGLHWAETIAMFEKQLPKLVENDSIVFDGIQNNQQIWWKLMTKDYGFLADHLVDIGQRRPSREEKIAFLQSRVRGTVGTRKGLFERREARDAV